MRGGSHALGGHGRQWGGGGGSHRAAGEPPSKLGRRFCRLALYGGAAALVAAIALLALLVAVVPRTGLYATYSVLSRSMEPAIPVGSIVVVIPADPASLVLGDVLTVTSQAPPYGTVTHRLVEIRQTEQGPRFRTQGDANLLPDPWDFSYSAQGGKVVASIPWLGYVLAWSGTSWARLALAIGIALLLVAGFFSAIWRAPRHTRLHLRYGAALAILTTWWLGGVLGPVGTTVARLTSSTENPTNTFATATQFAPTSFTATKNCTTNDVDLAWTAPSGGWATNYKVFRSTSTGTELTSGTLLTNSSSPAGYTTASASFSDNGALITAPYYYKVEAFDSSGAGGPSTASSEASVLVNYCNPAITSTVPSDAQTGQTTATKVAVTFDHAISTAPSGSVKIQACSPNAYCSSSAQTDLGSGVTPAISGSTITVTPSSTLSTNTWYVVTVGTSITDSNSLSLASAATFAFQTGTGTAAVAPIVVPPTSPVGTTCAPTTALAAPVIGGGGSLAGGTYQAGYTAVDASGNESTISPTTSFTVTGGGGSTKATVTLPATGPTGTSTFNLYVSDAANSTTLKLHTSGVATSGSVQVKVPGSGALPPSGAFLNTSVITTFSATMSQSLTQGAFSISPVAAGSFAWSGTDANIMTYTPSSNLTASTCYTVTISTAAKDIFGTAMASSYSFNFNTGSASDTTAPNAPIVTAPAAETWTTATSYLIQGTVSTSQSAAEFTYTVKVYQDNGACATYADGTSISGLSMIASQYLPNGVTNFDISTPLTSGVSNCYLVTATDSAGNQSTSRKVPTIHQTDNKTSFLSTSVQLVGGASGTATSSGTITVTVPFTGDANANNNTSSTSISWATASGGPFTCPVAGGGTHSPCPDALTRSSGQLTYSITGLSTGTTYYVKVVVGDTDGFDGDTSGCVTLTATSCTFTTASVATGGVSTQGGTQPVIFNTDTVSGEVSSQAPQYTTITVNGDSNVARFQVQVNTSSSKLLPNTISGGVTCVTPTGTTTKTATFQWDGKDGGGSFVADGRYSYTVKAFTSTTCAGTPVMAGGSSLITVSNIADLEPLSPAPSTASLSANQSVAVVATVRDFNNNAPPNGANTGTCTANGGTGCQIRFSASPSTVGTFTGGFTASGVNIGDTQTGCPTLTSGQACIIYTLGATKTAQTITITATASTQCFNGGTSTAVPNTATCTGGSPTTATTITASTTINDPPPPPSDLQLSLGSLIARWKPSPDPKVAGYKLSIGTAPGQYDTVIDTGPAAFYEYHDVTPGRLYYVAVQSYDAVGILSAPITGSLRMPAATPTPSATPATCGSATATATASPTATGTPATATPTQPASPTATATATACPTQTSSPTATATATSTATVTLTPSASATHVPPSPTATTPPASPTATATSSPTSQPSATPTSSPTATRTPAASTPTATATATARLSTPTSTATPVRSPTP